LLCTVGTSLFSNLRTDPSAPPANWDALKEAVQRKQWAKLGRELTKLDPRDRLCGAEINTLAEIGKREHIALSEVVFFVSDTDDGRATGKVLETYVQERLDLKAKAVVVEGLQDARPEDFKQRGLRNLVRAIGKEVHGAQPENVLIDATGGYKAQIAIAVLMGQVLDIPVLYKHERFSQIIDFPPLPVSFDYEFLGRHADLLVELERTSLLTDVDLEGLDPKLRVLLDEETIDGQRCCALSFIGQIYLTGYRERERRQPVTLPAARNRKPPKISDHNYPRGFKEFVLKVWEENPWIVTAESLPYDAQAQIRKGIGFAVRRSDGALVGTFKPDDFGARFRLRLEDENPRTLVAAAYQLNERYQNERYQ
jgi:putative CRISPR-associated protein (TIGR02619 family)